MKRLINATTILSLTLYIVPPFAAQAQDFPKVTVDGQEVLCLPDRKTACPDGAFCVVVKNPKNCEAKATDALAAAAAGTATPDQAAADQAAADQAAADQAAADQAAADKAVADQAAADQAAADQAAADQAAADQAAADQAAADKAAADQAAADQAAADKAAADQAAADQAAADQAAADQAAADQAAADHAAADKAAADQAAADQAAADKAAADQAAADKAAADQAGADQAAADKAAADQAAADQAAADRAPVANVQADGTTTAATDFATVSVGGTKFVCLPDKTAVCPAGALCVIAKTPQKCEQRAADKLAKMDAAAGAEVTPPVAPAEDVAALAAAQAAADAANAAAAADPNAVIVEAPVPTEEAVTTLETALDQSVNPDATVADAPVAAANPEPTADGTMPADAPPPANATVTTEVVTAEDTRASTQEFTAAPATVAPGKKTGLSDFEKVGLVALGALVIGAIIKGNRQVVQNTGDRVVVLQPDGSYQVYKDDNALLREPGSTVKTETYRDGSTRTIVTRTDGSQIVTIRDATGRVLQRVAYDTKGRGTVLIDDLEPETAIDVTTLPKPRPARNQIAVDDQDAQLRAQMAAADAEDLGRKFSLRQIRTIPQVRYLAATIDVNNITFETNSSAIQATEARKLKSLGTLMTRLIDENPGEIFLVEGHTDAVGSAASNLSLSDRRAESVAKALTEYFDVPPENLVVQGYGEGELKVDTQGNERANRRVAVRIITPLLYQAAN